MTSYEPWPEPEPYQQPIEDVCQAIRDAPWEWDAHRCCNVARDAAVMRGVDEGAWRTRLLATLLSTMDDGGDA